MQTRSVLDFTDYRAFLNAHFEDRKRANGGFSFGVWARLLGLKNSTSLLKILNGSRNAGPAVQEQLSQYFKFDERERAYFADLVQLSKVKSNSPLHGTLVERLSVRHTASRFLLLTGDQFAVMSDWWCYAIRQLTKLKSFESDARAISRRLRYSVTPKQVTNAVDRMVDLDMLEGELGGELKLVNEQVRTTEDVSNEAIKRFHEASFENCKQAVREVPIELRELGAAVFAFDQKDMPEAKKFLRSMFDQFEARFGTSPAPDQIYQLQIAFIPLTKELSQKRTSENDV